MKDSIPIERKFGYGHMVEMAAIRAALASLHWTETELHFAAIRVYEERHAGEPTYRERCAARRQITAPSPMREALMLIRDGHNDPRALAREILLLVDGP